MAGDYWWFKLAANFYRDPAMRAAERDVRDSEKLFVRGLGYCAEQHTGGVLHEHALASLEVATPRKKVEALVRHGLLVTLADGSGWVYRSWHSWQAELDALAKRRTADAERQARKREREREQNLTAAEQFVGQSREPSRDESRDVTVQEREKEQLPPYPRTAGAPSRDTHHDHTGQHRNCRACGTGRRPPAPPTPTAPPFRLELLRPDQPGDAAAGLAACREQATAPARRRASNGTTP